MANYGSTTPVLASNSTKKAVERVLADGVRTADLMGPDGGTPVSTSEMGDLIVAALARG